jgi:hypothetical protein
MVSSFAIECDMDVQQDTPYDYNSITHYPPSAFSKNGERTIETKPPGKSIGQYYNLSDTDVLEIRKFYKCFNDGKEFLGVPHLTIILASFS